MRSRRTGAFGRRCGATRAGAHRNADVGKPPPPGLLGASNRVGPPPVGPPSGPPPPGMMPPSIKGGAPPPPAAVKAPVYTTPNAPPFPMAEWPNAPLVPAPIAPPPLPTHLIKEPAKAAAAAAPGKEVAAAGGGGAKPTFVDLLKGLDKGGGLKKVDLTAKRASLTQSKDAATAIVASLEKTLASYRAAVEEEEEDVDDDADFD